MSSSKTPPTRLFKTYDKGTIDKLPLYYDPPLLFVAGDCIEISLPNGKIISWEADKYTRVYGITQDESTGELVPILTRPKGMGVD